MLTILPCLDSVELANICRRDLDMPREKAALLGETALRAAVEGHYVDQNNRQVDWSAAVAAARAAKVSIPPDATLPSIQERHFSETRIQVANETTFGAARRMIANGLRPLALNFANGVNPGGGFLHGARAQEEVLCRSSALYRTLDGDPMYAAHRDRPRPDSSDWAILSPDVPVFRDDAGNELARPWLLDVITCAAPYAPAIGQPESGDLLQRRIHRVLAIARAYGYTALVLGAWGCGAFANDPHRTARDFRQALAGEFHDACSDIVFAIADWSPERRFLGPFRAVFSGEQPGWAPQ